MGYLEGWVSQLVLIVLFAVILELLLPTGGFQKYVKLVIGLVLIVALLDPVIKLFHLDPGEIISGLRTGQGSSQVMSQTNQQKTEIEKAQSAYIQEEVAVQLKNSVKEELNGRYGLQIKHMGLSVQQVQPQDMSLKSITVIVAKSGDKTGAQDSNFSSVKPVKDVSINVESQAPPNNAGMTSAEAGKIRSFLAERWGVDKKIISLRMEGGD
ncbi:stage III sporulation protein AF [Sporolactobacillus pectinivorans]|uniref:stage III sporulation protein AF n=1 Tax=Sporolactobacillus pectinivorans TaxID=1591408 RepID=UPI000C263328|nr:stage III sporulation protein AF [Sporolactobacillus pectinivorans]